MLNIRIIKFTIGFALTLTASILYYILTKADEDEYLLELESRITRTKHYEIKKILIPKEDFHRVLGKKGSVINHIRQATNTKINLTDYEDQFIAIIKGKKENIQEAEAMIQKILAEKHDFETEEIFVQPHVCGKIIGRNGDTIRHMCEISGAKIIVERNSSNSDSQDLKKIVLKIKIPCPSEKPVIPGNPVTLQNK